jgi:hypothetical protein
MPRLAKLKSLDLNRLVFMTLVYWLVTLMPELAGQSNAKVVEGTSMPRSTRSLSDCPSTTVPVTVTRKLVPMYSNVAFCPTVNT